MRARLRFISEKYKAHRLPAEPFYLTRLFRTLFNNLIRAGRKSMAYRSALRAICRLRLERKEGLMYSWLLRVVRRARFSLVLRLRRKGRQMIPVPFPVRRNKRDAMAIRLIVTFIRQRPDRRFEDRVYNELYALAMEPERSPIVRWINSHYATVYTERTNVRYRWK